MGADGAMKGKVYTFYSYKGGVGRSMALANTAALLSRSGKRVLVVDWDLEAPGLERYFEDAGPGIGDSVRGRPGVVDIVTAIARRSGLDWRDCVVQVSIPGAPAPLNLITAGDRAGAYVEKLQQLDWDRLFLEREFGQVLESMRDEWCRNYDFVLVDSRTGLTDIGGICTIYLPDGLVAFFTANEQSIQGTAEILERARNARSALPMDRAALIVLPVAARDEARNEYQQSLEWRRKYAKSFGRYYEEFLPRTVSPTDAFEILRIPNVPYWSFGERLPILEEAVSDPSTLTFYYSMLAQMLATDFSWYDSIPTSNADESHYPQNKVELSGARGVLIGDSGTQFNYYGPRRPTLDAYREQFKEVAPEQLLDREVELLTLAKFCAGDSGILWIRGGPWVGKTALLAWFMANPPERVDVVGFLVTGRLAGQSSSDAFADALIDQLSSMLGGQRAETWMPSQRSALLQSLLQTAASETSRLGHTLVLVVDGLDEDSGRESIPMLPSIASMLPMTFDRNTLKILVSSRNSYELPLDLASGHPLHGSPSIELSPIALASDVRGLARGELRDLLLQSPAAQELTGIITVAEGEVSPADLADLTGTLTFRLEELFSGQFGRAFVRRDGGVYFAHDALRQEAARALGPQLLRRYQEQFNAWYDSSRSGERPSNSHD